MPTTGEILRRLDEQARSTERVVQRLDILTEKLEERYLPRGEYEIQRRADDARMTEVEKDIETQAAFRRQIGAGAMVGLLLLIAQTVVTVLLVGGGA